MRGIVRVGVRFANDVGIRKTVVEVVDDAGTVVSGIVVVSGSSAIAWLASTLLSATTALEGVPVSVDNFPGSDDPVAWLGATGNGAVARHNFFPLLTPHTQTTPFFLRKPPGVVHATDRPRAGIVEYQILPLGVVAHTTDDCPIFDTWPGREQADPAANAEFLVRGVELVSPHEEMNNAATNTPRPIFRKPFI